ncbi:unnamed protein product [Soboliphyme baturini]|uniref:Uncharacterized protein n=1 Tax=Soboliphyme baturini TaxID=241478 RepID=A0A183J5H2_9BILA|nr:unnamed protein product [Soboliphyme baturini]
MAVFDTVCSWRYASDAGKVGGNDGASTATDQMSRRVLDDISDAWLIPNAANNSPQTHSMYKSVKWFADLCLTGFARFRLFPSVSESKEGYEGRRRERLIDRRLECFLNVEKADVGAKRAVNDRFGTLLILVVSPAAER